MIVQWCCKGIPKLSMVKAEAILRDSVGLRCRGWIGLHPHQAFPISRALSDLTEHNLDLHVNNYSYKDAAGVPFYKRTPFISLSAGCVERDTLAKTNVVHRGLRTALDFATTDYTQPGNPPCDGWVFYCYVLVSANPAVTIPSVAEEIRELNHNRAYSGWYWQGEVAAKINIPGVQILCAERWDPNSPRGLVVTDLLLNLEFRHPAALLDERSML